MYRECKLGELEDNLGGIYDQDLDIEYYELPMKEDESVMITVEGIRVLLPELELSLCQGEYCVYDPEEDCYMADFSITLLYELNEKDPKAFLYWEQDGPQIALYNYLHNKDISIDELAKKKCIIEIEKTE